MASLGGSTRMQETKKKVQVRCPVWNPTVMEGVGVFGALYCGESVFGTLYCGMSVSLRFYPVWDSILLCLMLA